MFKSEMQNLKICKCSIACTHLISSLPAKLTLFFKDFRRDDVKFSVCSSSQSFIDARFQEAGFKIYMKDNF